MSASRPSSAASRPLSAAPRSASFTAPVSPGRDGGRQDDAAQKAIIFARQASVFLLKFGAASVRFIFEDLVQSACQAIFLIKRWHDPNVSSSSRAFTMVSLAAGILSAMAGPVKEYIAYRNFSMQRDSLKVSLEDEASATALLQKTSAESLAVADMVPNVDIEDFLLNKNGKNKHACAAHALLCFVNTVFWSTMFLIPLLLDKKLQCESDLPAAGHMMFFAVFILSVLVEIWVIIHSKRGFLLFRDHFPKFLLAVGFGFLGRFDTYSDVTFYKILSDCEPITWFSIKQVRIELPFGIELAQISGVCLVFGVGLFQALPGLVMLLGKCSLPMALKFSEFNLVLAVMEDDAGGKNPEEEEAAPLVANR
mmetsp:Transcript_72641/g.117122  ORF Transcript_72641/g.117122 Transcript_72641/m.117122 type:complete len:366 (+) Transcript_72641:108-1205(+)